VNPRKTLLVVAVLSALALTAFPAKAQPAPMTGKISPALGPPKAPPCMGAGAAQEDARRPTPVQLVSPARQKQRLDNLRAVNYYPAHHPWAYMWSQWDPRQIDADFGKIAALHANSVRLILQAATIGYPTPYPSQLKHIAQALSLAQKHHLTVELTLFDWWSSYTDIKGSKQWVCAVVGPYSGDRRIAFIELHNEIDTTQRGAVNWVKAMIPYLRSVDGGIPVDVSAFRFQDLQTLARVGHADFYSFHLIAGVEGASATLLRAERLVAPAPLYVGEVGTSTLLRWAPGHGCGALSCSESVQEENFRIVAYAAKALGLPPVVPWTLTDFAPHTLTWHPPDTEYDYGLYRVNGAPKPVAATVATYFATGKISQSFNNGFETPAGKAPAVWGEYHGWQAKFAWDPTVAHTGRASGRISHSTSDPTGGPAFFLSPVNAGVVPGRVYTLTAWARGLHATGETRIAMAWFDANGNYVGQIQSSTLAHGTTGWTQLSASAAAPKGAAYVQLHLKSFNNTGTAWFDDVRYT